MGKDAKSCPIATSPPNRPGIANRLLLLDYGHWPPDLLHHPRAATNVHQVHTSIETRTELRLLTPKNEIICVTL
jgi:hypothetical protein